MDSPASTPANPGRWTSLWVVAFLSLLGQLWLCQFFSLGQSVPMSVDMNPSNLWKFGYHFPPTGSFLVLNWFGIPNLPVALNPLGLGALLPPWLFFSAYAPAMATFSLLAMAAFLRELDCPRPAALFAAVIYAWQGDLLPFVFPAHFAYISTWPFYALAAWGTLRALRTRYWPYAIISGVSCGIMVQLQPDRGAIASLLIAAFYFAGAWQHRSQIKVPAYRLIFFAAMGVVIVIGLLLHNPYVYASGIGGLLIGLFATFLALLEIRHLTLCAGTALLVSLASFLALFQSNIVGVKLGGNTSREQTYKLVTQFSLGPAETVTYLVPGFFGWHSNHNDGPYWGAIGQTLDWPKNPHGTRNFNYAISTTGTVATVLALIGICLLIPGQLLGAGNLTDRQRFFGSILLGLGFLTLVFSWGWHTPLYRPLFALPLMDKWRNPLKWLEITNFALITLSAFGVQHLLTTLDANSPLVVKLRQRLTWFLGIIFGLLFLGLAASYPYTAFILPMQLRSEGYELNAIANIMSTLHSSLLVALLLVALLYAVLHFLWNPAWLRSLNAPNPWIQSIWQKMLLPENLPLTLGSGLILLAVLQLGWVTSQFLQPVNLRFITQTNPLLEALENEGTQVRVSVSTEDSLLDGMLLNQFNASKISCVDISAASRIPDDIGTFFSTFNGNQARMWFLAGVKNIVVPQQLVPQIQTNPDIAENVVRADGYTLEQTNSDKLPSHALVVLRDYMAKATFVPSMEALPEAKLLQRLKDPLWNPRERVLFMPPISITVPPAVGAPAATDSVVVKTYTPTEITIEAQTTRSGFILINDHYDPDWQVEVNGHKGDLLRADYILRAIPIPAGISTINLHYVAHYNVDKLALPVVIMNNFSDAAMILAWTVAGIVLWRRKTV